MSTIIIGIIVLGAFVAVICNMYRKKKKTGSICSCDNCSHCASAQYCHKK